MTRIAALLTCFNRKALTLATLESVLAQQTPGISIDVCPGCGGAWLDHGELTRIATRLWALQHDRELEEGTAKAAISWGSAFHYPRRHPKRRLGPTVIYR